MIELILLVCLIALGLAFYSADYADLIMLAGPMALASIIVLVRKWLDRKQPGIDGDDKSDDRARLGPRRLFKRKHLVIDGSNVLHWNDNQPDIGIVRQTVRQVKSAGFTPGVIFDANVGYKIGGGYMDDPALARLLDLPVDQVLVVPKGVQADQYILKAARDLGAGIVTNDRYRDWAGEFPEVERPGFLITGSVRGDKISLHGI
jgi:hypothetical protein